MKKLGLLFVVLTLTGCSMFGSDEEGANSLIQTLEFQEGDVGCVRIEGMIDLNPLPLITTTAQMVYKKSQGDNAPDC